MISGNVIEHLNPIARTGFLTSLVRPDMPWTRIANTYNLDAKSGTLVDLGGAPMPTQSKGGGQVQDFIEKSLDVKPIDWELVVSISYNAVQDDQTGNLLPRVKAAGENFQLHLNNLVFQTLDAGDGSTYGACYDTLNFFSNSHVDKGAHYTTVQDNLNALALSLDNFETIKVAAQLYRDDQGEFVNYNPNLIVCAPKNERKAANICDNPEDYATGNRARNPYSGRVDYLANPQIGADAWFAIDESRSTKPLIVVMREQPHLHDSWFDRLAGGGGRYYFMFYARYNVVYGDWRLCTMGNT